MGPLTLRSPALKVYLALTLCEVTSAEEADVIFDKLNAILQTHPATAEDLLRSIAEEIDPRLATGLHRLDFHPRGRISLNSGVFLALRGIILQQASKFGSFNDEAEMEPFEAPPSITVVIISPNEETRP